MGKDIVGVFIILIFLFLILKDASASSQVITSIANQTASTVAVLQGRQAVTKPYQGGV
jgi:hypothetical protein